MGVNYQGAYATPRMDLGEAFKEYMFDNAYFIGMQVFGRFDSRVKAGKFSAWKRASLLQVGNTKRAPRSAYNRGSVEAGDVTFQCEERGHEEPLDHGEREMYASDFDAEIACIETAGWRVLFDLEKAVRDSLWDTNVFTTGNGLRTDLATAWSNPAADIIGDVIANAEIVRKRTGMDPNALVVGAATLTNMLLNTAVRDAIKPTQLPSKAAIIAALSLLFGIDQVLVGRGVFNQADEGQDADVADVWEGGFASLVRVAPANARLQTPCAGRTIVWTSEANDAVMAEEYEEPQTNSRIYRARGFTDQKLIDPAFSQLLDIAG